eukprot:12502401-Alexandrium_andersonii.AAC.1
MAFPYAPRLVPKWYGTRPLSQPTPTHVNAHHGGTSSALTHCKARGLGGPCHACYGGVAVMLGARYGAIVEVLRQFSGGNDEVP